MSTANREFDFHDLVAFTDVMQTIFQYLNFEEQLKLAQVSAQLKSFFTTFIWKVDYTKVSIIKHPPNYHIKNDTGLNRLKLNPGEFAEFLKLYAPDIKELNEKCDPWLDIRKFPNLISLSYGNMTVTKAQFQSVAKHCKRLQKLNVNTCTNKDKDMLELGRDLEIHVILEMKHLKYLYMASCIQLPLKYRRFLDLITKTKIKHLNLFYYIESDERINVFNKASAKHLEELKVSTTFCEKWYGKNFPYYISLFENLRILKLNKGDDFDNSTIEVLAKTCQKLKELHIYFAEFVKVQNFNLLKSLEVLYLETCDGLSYTNLKEILTEMNLLKFGCVQTKFEGEFLDFPISQKIQSLDIHKLETFKFKGAIENNENLKSLIWYDYFYEPTKEPFTITCPHLEHLTVNSGFIPLEIVLSLNSLISFAIIHSSKDLCWSYITTLLRDHKSLKEFSFESLLFTQLTADLAPHEAFACKENLETINISPEVFEVAVDFWLDLLDKNRGLKLNCSGLFGNDFVRNIIMSPKFPTAFRVIYIHGFKVGK